MGPARRRRGDARLHRPRLRLPARRAASRPAAACWSCGWWVGFALIGAAGRWSRTAPRCRPAAPGPRSAGALSDRAAALPAAGRGGRRDRRPTMIVAVEHDQVAEVAGRHAGAAGAGPAVRDACGTTSALARTVQQREAQLQHLAFHDELTGLANRALFLDRLGHALDLAARNQRPVSVVFVDLDGFKAVNDSSGTRSGTRCWSGWPSGCAGALRPGRHAGPLGGDEFAVLVEQADEPAARRRGLLAALQAPFHLDGRTADDLGQRRGGHRRAGATGAGARREPAAPGGRGDVRGEDVRQGPGAGRTRPLLDAGRRLRRARPAPGVRRGAGRRRGPRALPAGGRPGRRRHRRVRGAGPLDARGRGDPAEHVRADLRPGRACPSGSPRRCWSRPARQLAGWSRQLGHRPAAGGGERRPDRVLRRRPAGPDRASCSPGTGWPPGSSSWR